MEVSLSHRKLSLAAHRTDDSLTLRNACKNQTSKNTCSSAALIADSGRTSSSELMYSNSCSTTAEPHRVAALITCTHSEASNHLNISSIYSEEHIDLGIN